MFFLAAKLSDNPTLFENLRYQAVGLTVVMLALASLWFVLEVMGYFFRRVKIKEASSSGNMDEDSEGDEVSPEIVAVIAAAVEASIKQPHRIASIQAVQITHDHAHGHAWALEGRRHIHSTRGTRS